MKNWYTADTFLNALDKIDKLESISGKTIDKLIELFKNDKIEIKKTEPLFQIGDRFRFDLVEKRMKESKLILYNPVGEIKAVYYSGSERSYKYRVVFFCAELPLCFIQKIFYEDQLEGLKL